MHESERVKRHLNGEDIFASPLWYYPGVPAFYGAIESPDSGGLWQWSHMKQGTRLEQVLQPVAILKLRSAWHDVTVSDIL